METAPTAAAQVLIAIIPIVGIVVGSVVVFFTLLWTHRRRMAMLQRGITPSHSFDFDTFGLLMGMLSTGVGAALSLFFLVKEGFSYSLLGGLIPLSVGISLLVFYRIRRTRPGT